MMRTFILFFTFFLSTALFAQDSLQIEGRSEAVIVRGQVKEAKGIGFESVYVYNTRTKSGLLADPDGSFIINMNKSDTLRVVAPGYQSEWIVLKDSVYKPVYFVKIDLEELVVQLEGVMIETPRDLEDIQEDIENLGSNSYEYNTEKVGQAILSPLTAIYERFSKDAKQRKELAKLENEALNRKVVKDLLNYYNQEGIIDLSQKEYDFFINFCELSDEFLGYASQYEIAVRIKNCYKEFEKNYQKY